VGIFPFLQPPRSENYRRWELANQTSLQIASLITTYGQNVLTDPNLKQERIHAAQKMELAYNAAKSIEADYLRESNAQLPEMYSRHFVKALKLWKEGFSEMSIEKTAYGNSLYNEFLLWIQSQNRDEFKPIR
jgi:tRNA U34 5-methylaminomethyl-2-thiouridine-forming methyltransferase MnmC